MNTMRGHALILITIVVLAFNLQAHGEVAPEVATTADRIMAEIMSPYCPGRLLRDCPSGQALQLKEKITARLQAGESEKVIVDDLIATFGEEIRATPRAQGFGLVAWVAPAVFFIFGGLLIFLWLRTRHYQIDRESPDTPLDSESEERLKRLVE